MAAAEPLRQQAVQWLTAEADKSPDAQRHQTALTSRYRKLREEAAFELAGKKDPAVFDALVTLLEEADQPGRQKTATEALPQLGDRRATVAFLNRVENDPTGTAQVPDLLAVAASFRRPESADRLLALADRKNKWQPGAFAAVPIRSAS